MSRIAGLANAELAQLQGERLRCKQLEKQVRTLEKQLKEAEARVSAAIARQDGKMRQAAQNSQAEIAQLQKELMDAEKKCKAQGVQLAELPALQQQLAALEVACASSVRLTATLLCVAPTVPVSDVT